MADDDFGHLSRKDNNFYIYGEITDDFPEKIIIPFIEEMKVQKDKRYGMINVYVNSPGGLMTYAMELVSLFEQCLNNGILVRTFVNDFAASAGSIIAVAGKVRVVGQNARQLIHHPSGFSFSSNTKQHENESEVTKAYFKFMLSHYKKYTKINDLEKKLEEGNHYIIGGKALIKQGLADTILETQLI